MAFYTRLTPQKWNLYWQLSLSNQDLFIDTQHQYVLVVFVVDVSMQMGLLLICWKFMIEHLFFTRFINGFSLFGAILAIFANFAWFWAFFAHILCANFSVLKFCVRYFVNFFHLWSNHHILIIVHVFILVITCMYLKMYISFK